MPCLPYSATGTLLTPAPARATASSERDFDALQLLAAQEKGVGVGDVAADFIGLTRETIEALDRDLVVGSDLVHGNVTQKEWW
jgi:hypothetical protein